MGEDFEVIGGIRFAKLKADIVERVEYGSWGFFASLLLALAIVWALIQELIIHPALADWLGFGLFTAVLAPLLVGIFTLQKVTRGPDVPPGMCCCRVTDLNPVLGHLRFDGSWLLFESEPYSFRLQPRDLPVKGGGLVICAGTLPLGKGFPGIRMSLRVAPAEREAWVHKLSEWRQLPSSEEPSIFPPLEPQSGEERLRRGIIRVMLQWLVLGLCVVIDCISLARAVDPLLGEALAFVAPYAAVQALIFMLCGPLAPFLRLMRIRRLIARSAAAHSELGGA